LSVSVECATSVHAIPWSRLAELTDDAQNCKEKHPRDARLVRVRCGGSRQGDAAVAPDILAACRDIMARSQQDGASHRKTPSSPWVWDDEIVMAAARHGVLDIGLLLSDEQPVAFAIHFRASGGVLHFVASGCVAGDNAASVERTFWSRLAHDSMQRGDQIALFSTQNMPSSWPWSWEDREDSPAMNVETVRTARGWQSRILRGKIAAG